MISGTEFTIEDPQMIAAACRGLAPTIASASEIAEIQAQCDLNRAMCLACPDGMIVIDLRPFGDELELFVWVAVGFKHGAFAKQDAALDLIGRDLGATTVAFQSRRRGWGRMLGPDWQRRGTQEFVRAIR
jgi:hypothetical protein